MGTLFRVKRLFKRLSGAVLRLLLGYPLNPIDSPCSPTGWAKTGLFIRGHAQRTSGTTGCLVRG